PAKGQEAFPFTGKNEKGGVLPFYDIGAPEKRRGKKDWPNEEFQQTKGERGFLFSFYKGGRLAFSADTFISIPYFLFLQGYARTRILFSATSPFDISATCLT
ncbi:hypothetical protein, partial [Akkermansia sp.]|uniref:hypothetical protein n=1 Tax=Akkermansia sp. TaxID=1872421 RepID=UPI0025B9CFCF